MLSRSTPVVTRSLRGGIFSRRWASDKPTQAGQVKPAVAEALKKGPEPTITRQSTPSPKDIPAAESHSSSAPREFMKVQKFSVFRFDPNSAEAGVPKFQDFDVNLNETGPMVLDALLTIKNTDDTTLSFRRSCREGICGSCAMNIDGKNGLACVTPIDPSREGGHTIRPLPHMFVMKDLVPDLSHFYVNYQQIQPWLQRKDDQDKEPHTKECTQSDEERGKLDGLYECIMCACCSTACPSQWWHPDAFLGPQALLAAHRWVSDSRDDSTKERLEALNDTMKLYRCHNIGNCTDCCPKGLKPSESIAKLKELVSENLA